MQRAAIGSMLWCTGRAMAYLNRSDVSQEAVRLQVRCLSKKKSKKSKTSRRATNRDQDYEKCVERELKQMRNLHKAAKWKRILSACDFWFSKANLATDSFVRETLKAHNGWIPIKTLLTFPKFRFWTDAQLLVEAFSSSAAARYVLTYDKRLTNTQSPSDTSMERREVAFLKHVDWNDPDIKQTSAVEKRSNYPDATSNGHETVDTAMISSQLTNRMEEHQHPLSHRSVSSSENSDVPIFAQVARDDNKNEDEDEDEDDAYDDWTDLDYSSEEDSSEGDESSHDSADPSIGYDSFLSSNTDVLPHNPLNAFVRHRKVRLDLIESLELEEEDAASVQVKDEWSGFERLNWGNDALELLHSDDDILERLHWDDDPFESFDEINEQVVDVRKKNVRTIECATHVVEVKKKRVRVIDYTTTRRIRVIRGVEGLDDLCQDVVQSARACARHNNGETNACAIGFDVEYCTLELDIRQTLPAMIQLSSPNKDGPIGIIWLDKFTNHGRNILSDEVYSPLATILADSSILKVGVGATKDAVNLAQWWSITDKKDMVHFFSGMTDLESEFDEKVNGKSLQKMCEDVLCRRLPKLKGKKRTESNRERTPTSHWRIDNMTAMMRNYAASDAASAIDVWMTIHGFQSHDAKKATRAKETTEASA